VTANLKCFGAQGHQRPNFDGFIYIRYAALPYSTGISAIYLRLAKSGWVPFANLRVRLRSLAMKYRSRMQNLRRVGKMTLPTRDQYLMGY